MQRERRPDLSGMEIERAFAQFVTGIVVVAASTDTAELAVSKVQAFSSVSLDPALVLWSLEKSCDAFPIFRRASRFIVHVLAHEQRTLIRHDSTMKRSNFAGAVDSGADLARHGQAFDGCSAWFDCAGIDYLDGGDHGCFIGQVHGFSFNDMQPLISYAGAYRMPRVHPDAQYASLGG